MRSAWLRLTSGWVAKRLFRGFAIQVEYSTVPSEFTRWTLDIRAIEKEYYLAKIRSYSKPRAFWTCYLWHNERSSNGWTLEWEVSTLLGSHCPSSLISITRTVLSNSSIVHVAFEITFIWPLIKQTSPSTFSAECSIFLVGGWVENKTDHNPALMELSIYFSTHLLSFNLFPLHPVQCSFCEGRDLICILHYSLPSIQNTAILMKNLH